MSNMSCYSIQWEPKDFKVEDYLIVIHFYDCHKDINETFLMKLNNES